jgi:hypothetical protein
LTLDERPCSIRGTIVDQENLYRGMGLREYGAQRLDEAIRPIVGRYDDTDQRGIHLEKPASIFVIRCSAGLCKQALYMITGACATPILAQRL